MDSNFYRNAYDEKSIHNEMDSHSYKNVQDENEYTMKWIVIRTEMCMTKTHTQRNG